MDAPTSRFALTLAMVLATGVASAAQPSPDLARKAPQAAALLAATAMGGTVRVIITLAMPGGASADDAALAARVRAAVAPFVADHFDAASARDLKPMPFVPMVAAVVSASQLLRIAADPRVTRIDADGIATTTGSGPAPDTAQ